MNPSLYQRQCDQCFSLHIKYINQDRDPVVQTTLSLIQFTVELIIWTEYKVGQNLYIFIRFSLIYVYENLLRRLVLRCDVLSTFLVYFRG